MSKHTLSLRKLFSILGCRSVLIGPFRVAICGSVARFFMSSGTCGWAWECVWRGGGGGGHSIFKNIIAWKELLMNDGLRDRIF